MDPIILAAVIQAIPAAIISIAAICGGGWAFYSHRVAQRLESAKWLQRLYADFYESANFDEIRIDLEYRYLSKVAPIIQKRISDREVILDDEEMAYLRRFDNFLNYFEFLLYMRDTRQLSLADIFGTFEYWFKLMNRDAFGALRTYTAFGFERLARALDAKYCQNIFLTYLQLKQIQIHAPTIWHQFEKFGRPAEIHLESALRSGGGGGLVIGTRSEPRKGLLVGGDDTPELAAQLDSILDFDAGKDRIGHRIRECVRAHMVDHANASLDSWIYIDKRIIDNTVSNSTLEIDHVILYGTLRPDQPDFVESGISNWLVYEKMVQFKGRMIDLGEYPGVLLGDSGIVVGALFKIKDRNAIERLDKHERYDPQDLSLFNRASMTGSLYIRKIVETLDGIKAYTYEFNGEILRDGVRDGIQIDSGDWIEYLRRRERH